VHSRTRDSRRRYAVFGASERSSAVQRVGDESHPDEDEPGSEHPCV
jgi:hypothetical protein